MDREKSPKGKTLHQKNSFSLKFGMYRFSPEVRGRLRKVSQKPVFVYNKGEILVKSSGEKKLLCLIFQVKEM